MGNYRRARRLMLAAACTCSAVAGIGITAAPGTAFACTLTGSGSSLQASQQTHWTGSYTPCTVTYTSTSSGKGLEEFGMPGGKLVPRLTPMDGFVGTDDPPTKALLKEGNEASETNPITVPVIAAPVAVIFHLPSGCVPTSSEFVVGNTVLSELWLGKYKNWDEFLTAAGVSVESATNCTKETTIKKEVRSDSSGTSFAFKQYLSQINSTEWSSFVSDAETWPTGTAALTTHSGGTLNEGSGGEATAVSAETGSVGYVNEANAVSASFKAYAAKATTFWARIRNTGAAGEPVSGTKGNCPSTLTTALTTAQKEEAKGEGTEGTFGPVWATVHLANKGTSTAYPLCTLTYDVGWAKEKYKTTKLEAALIYGTKAAEIGEAAKAYFAFMVSSTEGQSKVAEYYSALPSAIQAIAAEDASKVG
jgi:ABC-type phosphate transport system substrate-binding protein